MLFKSYLIYSLADSSQKMSFALNGLVFMKDYKLAGIMSAVATLPSIFGSSMLKPCSVKILFAYSSFTGKVALNPMTPFN